MSSEGTSFTLFPSLPAELRFKIWKHACPGPRIVPIMYKEATSTYAPRIAPPIVLQVNHESRTEALRIYHQLRLGPYINYGCYVDLRNDTVYIKKDFGFDSDNYFFDLESEIGIEIRVDIRAESIKIPGGWTERLRHYPMGCTMRTYLGCDPSIYIPAQVIVQDLLHSTDFERILPRLAIEAMTWYRAVPYFNGACFDSKKFHGAFLVFEKPNQSLGGEIRFWNVTKDDIQGMCEDEEVALNIARSVNRKKPEKRKWGSAPIQMGSLGIDDRPTKMFPKGSPKKAPTKSCIRRSPSELQLFKPVDEQRIASARRRRLDIWSIWITVLLCILLYVYPLV